MRIINRIVLHCTATLPNARVEDIKAYWREQLGWDDPGYHYIIDARGRRHILQNINKPTNGVRGYNSDSIHISYIGGISPTGEAKDTRTQAQKCETEKLLRELLEILPCRPDIVGHRDLSPDLDGDGEVEAHEWLKQCPSFEVKTWLKEIKL